MIIPISPIDILISDANRYLELRLFKFALNLDVQMTLLKYGPDYLEIFLDSIIQELSGEGVVGCEEN
jgi:hypothetical protein